MQDNQDAEKKQEMKNNKTDIQDMLDTQDISDIEEMADAREMVYMEQQHCCHTKATPRQEKELRQLKNRLSRIVGQLNGIGRMLDENRYCGEILVQLAAIESALQSFGYVILKEHMETCVVEEIQKGNTAIVEEAVELIKKLK